MGLVRDSGRELGAAALNAWLAGNIPAMPPACRHPMWPSKSGKVGKV